MRRLLPRRSFWPDGCSSCLLSVGLSLVGIVGNVLVIAVILKVPQMVSACLVPLDLHFAATTTIEFHASSANFRSAAICWRALACRLRQQIFISCRSRFPTASFSSPQRPRSSCTCIRRAPPTLSALQAAVGGRVARRIGAVRLGSSSVVFSFAHISALSGHQHLVAFDHRLHNRAIHRHLLPVKGTVRASDGARRSQSAACRYICTVARAKLIICVLWAFCILYNSPWLYLATVVDGRHCSFTLDRESWAYVRIVTRARALAVGERAPLLALLVSQRFCFLLLHTTAHLRRHLRLHHLHAQEKSRAARQRKQAAWRSR